MSLSSPGDKNVTRVSVEDRKMPPILDNHEMAKKGAIMLLYADVISKWLDDVISSIIREYESTEKALAPLVEIANALKVASRLAGEP
mgnify:CR=1 FL=1